MTLRSTLLTILNILSAFIALILAARIIFLFVGANQSTPAIVWINNISNFFLYPFRGLFHTIVLNANSVIDVTAIVALLIYAIVFSILYRLVYMLTRPTIGTTEIRTHSHAEY
jgi:uncharacterized protein YggT (Ycf19 family)